MEEVVGRRLAEEELEVEIVEVGSRQIAFDVAVVEEEEEMKMIEDFRIVDYYYYSNHCFERERMTNQKEVVDSFDIDCFCYFLCYEK